MSGVKLSQRDTDKLMRRLTNYHVLVRSLKELSVESPRVFKEDKDAILGTLSAIKTDLDSEEMESIQHNSNQMKLSYLEIHKFNNEILALASKIDSEAKEELKASPKKIGSSSEPPAEAEKESALKNNILLEELQAKRLEEQLYKDAYHKIYNKELDTNTNGKIVLTSGIEDQKFIKKVSKFSAPEKITVVTVEMFYHKRAEKNLLKGLAKGKLSYFKIQSSYVTSNDQIMQRKLNFRELHKVIPKCNDVMFARFCCEKKQMEKAIHSKTLRGECYFTNCIIDSSKTDHLGLVFSRKNEKEEGKNNGFKILFDAGQSVAGLPRNKAIENLLSGIGKLRRIRQKESLEINLGYLSETEEVSTLCKSRFYQKALEAARFGTEIDGY